MAWTIAHGERSPTARQWMAACFIAILIFVLDYGLLFWAEQRVPSGVAAVMMATIPVFTALFGNYFSAYAETYRPFDHGALNWNWRSGRADEPLAESQGAPIDKMGALALIVASISWSLASVLTRKVTLPPSKVMSSGAQMLAGGVFLALTSAALGEFRGFHPWTVSLGAWLALLYLIVAGSIIAFTAYVWLIHHESPTKVGTYAYVNPVVAVLVGYFLGGETLGLRTILGTLFVLTSVVVITSTRAEHRHATLPVVDPANAVES